MKRSFLFKVGVCLLALFIVLYLTACLAFSITFNRILKEVNHSKSYDDVKSFIYINKDVYEQLNAKMSFIDEQTDELKDSYSSSFPIALIGINKCKIYYRYSYYVYDENGDVAAGCKDTDANVTIQFIDGKFTITKYWEHI